MRLIAGCLLVSALVVTGCAEEVPAGPPLDLRHNTRDLMAGMIDASADALWDAVGTVYDTEGVTSWEPETEEEWLAVTGAAMTLMESGNLLMLGTRKRDDELWIEFAQEMIDTFEEVFASKTTAEWVEELNANDIPCGPIRFSEDLVWDEQAVANDYIIELEHHTGQRYRTSGPILNFTAGMPEMEASPALGEHNWEILREAGMTDEEIEAVVG